MKGNVLCLHGFLQDSLTFSAKTGQLRNSTFKGYTLKYPDAPLKVSQQQITAFYDRLEIDAISTTTGRTWYNYSTTSTNSKTTLIPEMLSYLEKYIKDEGPFVGIMVMEPLFIYTFQGFSQGASVAALVTALVCNQSHPTLFKDTQKFKFCILFSGFLIEDIDVLNHFGTELIQCKTFLAMGMKDEIVLNSRTARLGEKFGNVETCRFDGGHYVPATKEVRDGLKLFLDNI